MALQKQFFRVNFGQGLDTKTDPKVLSSGKMVVLQNAKFQTNQICKRDGFAAVGVPDSTNIITTLLPYSGGLLGIGASTSTTGISSVYTIGSSGSFNAVSPMFNNCQATSQEVVFNTNQIPQGDSATANGMTLHAWYEIPLTGTTGAGVFYEVVSVTTGQVIVPPTSITSSTSKLDVRVLAVGSGILVGYCSQASTTSMNIAYFNTSTTTLAASTSVGVTISSTVLSCQFDWATIGSSVLLVTPSSTTSLQINVVSNTATVISTTTTVLSHALLAIGVAVPYTNTSATLNILLSCVDDKIYRLPTNTSLALGSIVSTSNTSGNASSYLITGQERSDGSVVAFVSTAPSFNVVAVANFSGASGTFTLSGNQGPKISVYSKPVYQNDNSIYLWGVYSSSVQGQYQLFQWIGSYKAQGQAFTNQLVPAARILAGDAVALVATVGGFWCRVCGNVDNLGSGLYRNDCISVGQTYSSTSGISQFGALSQLNLNFSSTKNYSQATLNGQQVIAGGFAALNDGAGITELGFFTYPENIISSVTTSGGSIGVGVFQYIAIYEWLDNQGNLHRSETSIPISVTTSGGTTNAVTLVVYPPNTLKNNFNNSRRNASVAVYRTTASANPEIFYRINNSINYMTTFGVTIVDTTSDANITANEILYTQGGILDNYTIDGPPVICAGPDRLFAADPNNNGIIHVGPPYTQTNGLSFFSGITILVPVSSSDGPVTAMFYMDSNLIILYGRKIFAVGGVGPTANGQNNGLGQPQLITSDVGADGPRAVTLYPDGILFKSAKGYYRLGHDLSFSPSSNYIGSSVEAFNHYTCLRATCREDANQCRFALSDNATILYYDYLYQQWSTIQTSVTDIASTGTDFYIASATPSIGALVGKETVGTFADALTSPTGITFNITLGWIALNQLQGCQRIYRVRFLGDLKSSHTLKIDFAYDYESSFAESHTITSTNITGGSSAYQCEAFPLRQKCEAIQIRVSDVSPTGESFDLTDIELEVGLIPGRRFPLAAAKGAI